jgi:hypothetical protein
MPSASTTLSVTIHNGPQNVYDFVSNGANLPKWATTFCLSAEPDGDGWRVQTPQGPATIRLAPWNRYGILDHTVIPDSGETIYVPMRVVPNGTGCEVFFTLFHLTFMSPERLANDLALVRKDLDTLKVVMENKR